MLFKFKSRATADLVMLEATGRRVLEILGKDPAAPGILLADQMPAAVAALQEAVRADEVERELFRIRKDKLLEDLDADVESRFHRFIPDRDSMSYKLDNPARRGDTAYLSRTGAMSPVLR